MADAASMDDDDRRYFAAAVLSGWDDAMNRFFEVVDKERRYRDLTDSQATEMLQHCYGDDISSDWDAWRADSNG